MGKAVNRVFLIGRLTRDVEVNTTKSGKNVASFSMAVDKATAPQGDGPTADFFDCVAWEKTADLLSQYTQKGSRIHVEGSLQQSSWEDKDGNKRSKVEVVVRDVTFLDSKSDSQSTPRDNAPEDIDDKPIDLSEIPF